MAELVRILLEDLGLYGYTPTTFGELIVWFVSLVVAAVLVAGTIKTFLMICRSVGNGGTRL